MWRRTAAAAALRVSSSRASSAVVSKRATGAQRELLFVHARRSLRVAHAASPLAGRRCMTTSATTSANSGGVEKPATTPMVTQYLERKKEYPGNVRIRCPIPCLLLLLAVLMYVRCLWILQTACCSSRWATSTSSSATTHDELPTYVILVFASVSRSSLCAMLCVQTDHCFCRCTARTSYSTWR